MRGIARDVLPSPFDSLLAEARPLLWLGVVLLHLVLIVDGVRGRGWRLPLITPYVERILRQRAPEAAA